MYHPDSMLRIAHDREVELIREAQLCGVPKVEPKGVPFPTILAQIVLGITMLATALRLLAG